MSEFPLCSHISLLHYESYICHFEPERQDLSDVMLTDLYLKNNQNPHEKYTIDEFLQKQTFYLIRQSRLSVPHSL